MKEEYAYESRPVNDKQKEEIQELREAFKVLTSKIASLVSPTDGRCLSLCKTNLEQASMWVTKAITHAD